MTARRYVDEPAPLPRWAQRLLRFLRAMLPELVCVAVLLLSIVLYLWAVRQ